MYTTCTTMLSQGQDYVRCLRQTQAIWLYPNSVLVDKRHTQLSEDYCCHEHKIIFLEGHRRYIIIIALSQI